MQINSILYQNAFSFVLLFCLRTWGCDDVPNPYSSRNWKKPFVKRFLGTCTFDVSSFILPVALPSHSFQSFFYCTVIERQVRFHVLKNKIYFSTKYKSVLLKIVNFIVIQSFFPRMLRNCQPVVVLFFHLSLSTENSIIFVSFGPNRTAEQSFRCCSQK